MIVFISLTNFYMYIMPIFYMYIMPPYLCNPETKTFLDQNLEMKNLLIFSFLSKNYNMVIYKGFKAKDLGFLDFDPHIFVFGL